MNGFRITILTLLCLSVALMFYVVLYEIPSWQDEYKTYRSTVRISEYDKKSDLHRQQMRALDPAVESPEEEQARLADEEADRLNEQSLQEAEERVIVDAARRREEAAQARARAEAEAKAEEEAKAAQPQTIGIVASYDQEWSCIMIKPAVVSAFGQGTVLAVRRNGRIVCEAVVDGLDVASGQVSATVKMEQFGADGEMPQVVPIVGDEVIISPFLSGEELRADAAVETATPIAAPTTFSDAPAQLTPLPVAPAVQEEPLPTAQEPVTEAVAASEQPVESTAAEPTTPESNAAEPVLPALEPEPVQPVVPQEETTAPAQEDVQKALDVIPATQPTPEPRSNSSLPSLDAMLHSPLF